MNKKFYVTPETEVLDVDIKSHILDVSNGGGDPEFGGETGDVLYD